MSVWAGAWRSTLVAVLSFVLLLPPGHGAERCEQWAARLDSAQGSVEVQFAGSAQWHAADQGDVFCEGDTVTLGKASRAALRLPNETVLRLDELSSLRLTSVKREDESLLDMLKGAIHFLSRVPRSLKVRTPFVNAAIEGTEFVVRVDVALAQITVFEGVVAASNELGTVRAAAGEGIEAPQGEAPRQVTVVAPLDAVQWALYYPPVFDMAELERSTASQRDQALQRRINDKLYSAARELYVGRVIEAEAALAQVTELAPDSADVLALRTVVAVARNYNEQALALAQRAMEQAPDSAAARIAMSYARQAKFDLPAATGAARKATELSPDNALAHARLAELLLSQGELDAALKAAQMAAKLNPELGRTQTILGFAYLTRINTREAQTSFERAITLDPADPLPRLGLGLTRIRRGALEEGREHIEVAASLDPNNALVRSYLGKAYYEERRNPLAAVQYDLAKGLGPNDPTPWFYDAIRKQTENRPVEALEDINKSIELNDNRAVFRSRLQLDQDEAARNVSQARIYQDLGFEGLALKEGANAVNDDPTNHSAHRFLSDSYLALPRHEAARVSELLQSQLLQPANLTPLQPQLSQTNLGIVTTGGPTQATFNELGPLFTRDGFAFQVDAAAGTNDTYGGDLILAGLQGRTSFSVGYFGYRTDGFRENNDQEIDSSNLFLQHDISPALSLQLGGSRTRKDRGDLPLRFDPDNFLPTLRLTEDEDFIRGGLRYSHSTRNNLIASVVYADTEFTSREDIPDLGAFGVDTKQDGYTAELSDLHRFGNSNLTVGMGFVDLDTEDTPIDFGVAGQRAKSKTKHSNAYAYYRVELGNSANLTLGASADRLEDSLFGLELDREQLSPKFGLNWRPVAGTTLRAAAFKTLKRPLVADQTIEPTQVEGFNQFFDDQNGTRTERYGLAWDQRFARDLFFGIELSERKLDVPYQYVDFVTFEEELRQVDWDEKMGSAYLNWSPISSLALSLDYLYEEFSKGEEYFAPDLFSDLRTHQVKLGAAWFWGNGLSLAADVVHVQQKGEFLDFDTFTFAADDEDFTLLNASIRYRLPRRAGIVSVGAMNLTDRNFRYQDTNPESPRFYPERFVFGKVSLYF